LARKRLAASSGPVERGITIHELGKSEGAQESLLFLFPPESCFLVLLRLRARAFWFYKSEINVGIAYLRQGVFVSSVGEGISVEK
jgi:hypothetical protein